MKDLLGVLKLAKSKKALSKREFFITLHCERNIIFETLENQGFFLLKGLTLLIMS